MIKIKPNINFLLTEKKQTNSKGNTHKNTQKKNHRAQEM